jgi:hypothetical protein
LIMMPGLARFASVLSSQNHADSVWWKLATLEIFTAGILHLIASSSETSWCVLFKLAMWVMWRIILASPPHFPSS